MPHLLLLKPPHLVITLGRGTVVEGDGVEGSGGGGGGGASVGHGQGEDEDKDGRAMDGKENRRRE